MSEPSGEDLASPADIYQERMRRRFAGRIDKLKYAFGEIPLEGKLMLGGLWSTALFVILGVCLEKADAPSSISLLSTIASAGSLSATIGGMGMFISKETRGLIKKTVSDWEI